MEWFWCRYEFILTLYIFYIDLVYSKAATMSPCKVDIPTFVDNK